MANELVKPFHVWMSMIFPPERYVGWIAHDTPAAEPLSMLMPFPSDRTEVVKLAPAVNSAKNDGPECLGPAA